MSQLATRGVTQQTILSFAGTPDLGSLISQGVFGSVRIPARVRLESALTVEDRKHRMVDSSLGLLAQGI